MVVERRPFTQQANGGALGMPGQIRLPRPDDEDYAASSSAYMTSMYTGQSHTSSIFSRQVFPYSVGLCLTAALCYFNFGYSVGVTNALEGYMVQAAGWCDDDPVAMELSGQSINPFCPAAQTRLCIINAILYLGAVGGAILGSQHMHAKGRRKSLVLANIFYSIGALTCGFGSSTFAFVSGRIIGGVGVGITTICVPTLIRETTAEHQRGFLGGLAQSFIGLGIVAAAFLEMPLCSGYIDVLLQDGGWGWSHIRTYYWRVCYLIPIMPAISGLILWWCIYPYDTPSWLVQGQRYQEAHQVLKRIHSNNSLDGLMASTGLGRDANFDKERSVTDLINLTKDRIMFGHDEVISLRDVFSCPVYRWPLLIGLILAVVQQLTGINSLVSSSNRIFKDANMSSDGAMAATFLLSMSNYVATCLASFLIEFVGRKRLLQGGCFLMSINLMLGAIFIKLSSESSNPTLKNLEAFATAWNVIAAVFCFSLSLGPTTWVYLAEIFPPESAGASMCACGVINWLSSFACVSLGRSVDTQSSLLIFAAIGLFGFISITKWAKETKGYTGVGTAMCSQADREISKFSLNHQGQASTPAEVDSATHSILHSIFTDKGNSDYKKLLNEKLLSSTPNYSRNSEWAKSGGVNQACEPVRSEGV